MSEPNTVMLIGIGLILVVIMITADAVKHFKAEEAYRKTIQSQQDELIKVHKVLDKALDLLIKQDNEIDRITEKLSNFKEGP
jgi:hemerythrin